MIVVSMVAAMVYGPWQLWVLASPTRTIRFRTVLLGLLTGTFVTFPIAVGIQWAWVRVAGRWWDGFTFELVEWAGWTVDPFIEELVRLLPLVLVIVVVAGVRRQWSLTDLAVLGAALGSGFRVAEHLARHAEEVRAPFSAVTNDNGWVIGNAGMTGTAVVPYPWVWFRGWVPEGVRIFELGGGGPPIGTYNLSAIWSMLGGLAVGLWLVIARRTEEPSAALAAKVASVGLVVLAGLAHAQANADLAHEEWPLSLLSIPRLLEPWYATWPLAALGAAMVIDGVTLRRTRSRPELDSLRITDGPSDTAALLRLVCQRPLVSVSAVWSFVTARRAHLNLATSQRLLLPDRAADGLGGALIPVAARLRDQWRHGGGLWAEVRADRRALRRERRRALLESRRFLAVAGASMALSLMPLAYFVAGTMQGGHRVQEWLATDGWLVTIGASAAALVLGVVLVVYRIRSFSDVPDAVAELRARSALGLAVQLGSVLSMAVGLALMLNGDRLDQTVVTNSIHGLDALGSMLWSAALTLGIGGVIAVNPLVGIPLARRHLELPGSAQLPPQVQLATVIGSTAWDYWWHTAAEMLSGGDVVLAEGRAVPGAWDDGPKPPPPLDAELDAIIEHAWDKHVVSEPSEFPEITTEDEFRELLDEVIENATEWGYREDGAIYWYDEVTDTMVIKNPPGVGGTTYRPGPEAGGGNP